MDKPAPPYLSVALLAGAALAACTGSIGPMSSRSAGGASSGGSGATTGIGGTAPAAGTGGSLTGLGGDGGGPGGTGGAPVVLDCSATAPGRSPLRRLTTYEYNNTIRDLLGDTTSPGTALPAQVDS